MFCDNSISFSSVSSVSSISNSTSFHSIISRSSIFSNQHDPTLFSNQNTISEPFPSRRENNLKIETKFNFGTPTNTSQVLEQDISLPGSPLLTTNRDSCSYTSVVTYMQKHFNTPNLCKLEHKTCGLKRLYGESQATQEERAWIEADHELHGASRRLKKLKLTSPNGQQETMDTPIKMPRFGLARNTGENGMYRGGQLRKMENGYNGGLAPFNLDKYKGQCYENYLDESKQKMYMSVFWIAPSLIIAQDCNNPLLEVFNLTGLDKPTKIKGLPFCSELQNGTTCCSNSTIRGLQERLDNLTAAIQELAGDRDIYIAQLNENFTRQYEDVAKSLQKRGDDVEMIQAINETIGDPIKIQYDSLNLINAELHEIIYWEVVSSRSGSYIVRRDNNYKQFFVEFQIQRAVCLKKLLEIQASVYCLACNPNYAFLGVRSDGSINSAESICEVIQENCAPMLYRAGRFQPIYQAEQSLQRLIDLTNYLNAFHDTDKTFIINVTYSGGVPHYTKPIQRTNSLPEGCNQTYCPWQCSHFFSPQFVMNKTVVANGGGIIGGADVYFSDIGALQPSPEAGRLLQNASEGVWNPELGTTGIKIVVDMDPAHVTNWDGSDYSDAEIDDHLGGSRMMRDMMSFNGLLLLILLL